jgi:hypothetical protein
VRFGGEDGGTCGTSTSRRTWVRIQHRCLDSDVSAAWTAEESAAELANVRKPRWHQAVTWHDQDNDVEWRADELDLVRSPVLGGLTEPPTTDLPDRWWADLKRSLDALADQSTDRVALDQATVTRLITREFGSGVDTIVDEWTTAHGDLVWPNVTRDGHLLDWEGWGIAPRGLDAASLWGLALPRPDLAAKIQEVFAADLTTRSGRLVQLMWCATALRPASKRPDLAHYFEPVRTAAHDLLAQLKQ